MERSGLHAVLTIITLVCQLWGMFIVIQTSVMKCNSLNVNITPTTTLT